MLWTIPKTTRSLNLNTHSVLNTARTMRDTVAALSQGHPAAFDILIQSFEHGHRIDPSDWAGSFGFSIGLDTYAIYGNRICMLYKDVCRDNLSHTIALLRSVHLGIISQDTLNHAIDNRGDGLDVIGTVAKVKERLPRFIVE